ncbi:MAG: leucine-rich repeat protein, partial [Lachnospiraceae bacterium]|nr:leucine-rich repeat protein [Lachnospiraceae bacterium]
FHRRAEDQDSTSKYAHILDFDSMKLGKKFIQDNTAAMEFGVKCVTEIGKDVFQNCKSLIAVRLPKSLERIGRHVFLGCSRLKSADISVGATKIKD